MIIGYALVGAIVGLTVGYVIATTFNVFLGLGVGYFAFVAATAGSALIQKPR